MPDQDMSFSGYYSPTPADEELTFRKMNYRFPARSGQRSNENL